MNLKFGLTPSGIALLLGTAFLIFYGIFIQHLFYALEELSMKNNHLKHQLKALQAHRPKQNISIRQEYFLSEILAALKSSSLSMLKLNFIQERHSGYPRLECSGQGGYGEIVRFIQTLLPLKSLISIQELSITHSNKEDSSVLELYVLLEVDHS